ncbi:hypothetical protein NJC40_08780 [Pseudomonas sp. 21LCFQ02]|uniref:hypothetical protein n=1 Tax=Pseudomonas sp. 21LCFQ02 TaxID=2957505 RepID=UPI00209B5E8A|nr:hypothetical protein [Pseudomonas sp. 21LCFQ02]MCO8167872.1 hypothetical protein [Pseudomonas sp. 21LCFQ02]
MKIENGKLTVDDGRVIAVPAIQADAVARVWEVPKEYRDNGLFVAVVLPGQPPEIPACDQAAAMFLGEVEYPAPESGKLAAAKVAKLIDLNAACERALGELSSAYPPAELQSWPQQVAEAAGLQLDPPAQAPLLTAIAEARGVAVAELAGRVQQKALAYAEFSGVIIGKRQRLEDELDAAETLEAVSAISW